MIRNITVDGEEALAVDTAEELGRALLTGRYVVASDAVRAEYGLTDTDNSDTQDIVDESPVSWGRRGHCELVDEDTVGHPTKLITFRLADDAELFARLAQRGLGTVLRRV